MLTTYEKRMLADFILQSGTTQLEILELEQQNPKTSGPLIAAYKWAVQNT